MIKLIIEIFNACTGSTGEAIRVSLYLNSDLTFKASATYCYYLHVRPYEAIPQ